MRRRFLLAGLAALTITGCSAHVGNKYHTENVSQLVPGKTTYSEAVDLIGHPVKYELQNQRYFDGTTNYRHALWAYYREIHFFNINLYSYRDFLSVSFDRFGVLSPDFGPALLTERQSIFDSQKRVRKIGFGE